MRFKWGPFGIGSSEDHEGGVDVMTFRQAWITTAFLAVLSGAIWLLSLTEAEGGFWRLLILAYFPVPLMALGFVWLGAVLSWVFRDFRKQG